ncbi:anthranilate synthase component II [Flavobacterium wongokense]|uniref:anthranilate synthase component II n=1 Tax=Flavobacterium wongokense TaxID=2910674 RepID=UPI001F32703B|nr:aminodeoxychorismate/anthranilate synthase component II [Flavobacterium sp. WG47]MCF6131910.1 aminodeoxychorismate/anthranilate synthase component II [Flavobacterium sp. WG47]
MKKIVVIDNYDSFTFNLVHYLEALNAKVTVYRNDEFDIEDLQDFDKILLSPGPGIPDEAGLLKKVIAIYAPTKSILGICLGHQAIAEVFSSNLTNLKSPLHGISSKVKLTNNPDSLFDNIPSEFEVGLYHSWIIEGKSLSNDLIVTSVNENDYIMSIRHQNFDVKGIQFHPESILTPYGKTILKNWIEN